METRVGDDILRMALVGYEAELRKIEAAVADIRRKLSGKAGPGVLPPPAARSKPRLSAAGRAAIVAALRRRWAAVRSQAAPTEAAEKPGRPAGKPAGAKKAGVKKAAVKKAAARKAAPTKKAAAKKAVAKKAAAKKAVPKKVAAKKSPPARAPKAGVKAKPKPAAKRPAAKRVVRKPKPAAAPPAAPQSAGPAPEVAPSSGSES